MRGKILPSRVLGYMQYLRGIVVASLFFIGGSALFAAFVTIAKIGNGNSENFVKQETSNYYNLKPASEAVFHLCRSLEDADKFFDLVVRSNYWLAMAGYDNHQERCPAYNLKYPEVIIEVISETSSPIPGYSKVVFGKIIFTDIGDRYMAVIQKETTGLSEGAQHAIMGFRTENGINEALNEAISGN